MNLLIAAIIAAAGGSLISKFFTGSYDTTGIGSASLTFETDGSCTIDGLGGPERWFTGTPISGVSVRLRKSSGNNFAPDNDDTWLALSSPRTFTINVAPGTQTWIGYVDFSLDGGSTTLTSSELSDIGAEAI